MKTQETFTVNGETIKKVKLSQYLGSRMNKRIKYIHTSEGTALQISVEDFTNIIKTVQSMEFELELFWEKFGQE